MAYIIGQASRQEIDNLRRALPVDILTDEQITGLFGQQNEEDKLPEGESMIMVYVDYDAAAIIGAANFKAIAEFENKLRATQNKHSA